MEPLIAFKKRHNLDKIQVMQGKGRKYFSTPEGTVFVGEKVDTKAELFIIAGAHDALWCVNSSAQIVEEL